MPGLDSSIHLDMVKESPVRQARVRRLLRAVRREWSRGGMYGMEWGDPELVPPLGYIRGRFLDPYVRSGGVAIEIGPGGGRWTQYLRSMDQVYVVDYFAEILDELPRKFHKPNIIRIKNNGTDFPGVPRKAADFVFSFGAFVHLDAPLIESYLANLHDVVKSTANLVIHYSDKTKIMAQLDSNFSQNDPSQMRRMVEAAGYRVVEEDTTSMWHSSVIRFVPPLHTGRTETP